MRCVSARLGWADKQNPTHDTHRAVHAKMRVAYDRRVPTRDVNACCASAGALRAAGALVRRHHKQIRALDTRCPAYWIKRAVLDRRRPMHSRERAEHDKRSAAMQQAPTEPPRLQVGAAHLAHLRH